MTQADWIPNTYMAPKSGKRGSSNAGNSILFARYWRLDFFISQLSFGLTGVGQASRYVGVLWDVRLLMSGGGKADAWACWCMSNGPLVSGPGWFVTLDMNPKVFEWRRDQVSKGMKTQTTRHVTFPRTSLLPRTQPWAQTFCHYIVPLAASMYVLYPENDHQYGPE